MIKTYSMIKGMLTRDKIWRKHALICIAAACLGCRSCVPIAVPVAEGGEGEVELRLGVGDLDTKSVDPDEESVSSVNLFVFNDEGKLEEERFVDRRHMTMDGDTALIRLGLLKDVKYDIFVFANFGYAVGGIAGEEDIRDFRYYLSYPDEYAEGVPACGKVEGLMVKDGVKVDIPLTRMMSKVSLRMDRSRLEKDVKMIVRSVQIGNCPKSCLVFGRSGARGAKDVFTEGFIKSYAEADALNIEGSGRLSDEVSVYLFENIQDRISRESSSYIEIKSEYESDKVQSRIGEYLIYRFYLEDPDGGYGVERNCHYHVTVRPEGSGLLTEDGWKVDKKGLEKRAGGKITVHPGTYIEAMPGDTVHVWAETDPPDAEFTMGMEELEDDRKEGLYDYEMDENGRGVRLFLKKPGSGLLYMSSGNPIYDSAAIVVVIDHYPGT